MAASLVFLVGLRADGSFTRSGTGFVARADPSGGGGPNSVLNALHVAAMTRERGIVSLAAFSSSGASLGSAVEMALREDDPAGLRNLFVNRQKDVIHPDSGNPVTLGRALLEANLRNWRGNLDFTLPGSTEWFEAYVGVWDGGPGPPRSS